MRNVRDQRTLAPIRAILFLLLSGSLLGACRERPSTGASASVAKASSPANPPATSGPAAAPLASSAAPSGAAATQNKAVALVERWRAAQSAGDFASYEKLYAKNFTGIKRVGSQTLRFDRKRWLADRRGMLALKPEVTVASLSVVELAKTPVARFEQTYASKNFRDVGTKQLVLLEENGELRIGREEMLTSLVAAPTGVAAFPDFAFVEHSGGKAFVLLERHERNPAAPLEYVDLKTALSLADEKTLPSTRRDLVGKELALHNEAGALCRTRVARVVTLARAIAHFGQHQEWSGALGKPPPSEATIARNIAELAESSGSYLALELQPNLACAQAIWARAADRPAAAAFARRKATAEEEKAALAAFQRLPVHAANQERFEEENQQGSWLKSEGLRQMVNVFEANGSKWLSVSIEVGTGCGDYRGAAWVLLKEENGTLQLASHDADHTSFFLPQAAFDANGDGSPEFVGSDLRLAQSRNGRHRLVLDLAPPSFDCGC